jgi:hypothetical protein
MEESTQWSISVLPRETQSQPRQFAVVYSFGHEGESAGFTLTLSGAGYRLWD